MVAAKALEEIEAKTLAEYLNTIPDELFHDVVPYLNPVFLSDVYTNMNQEKLLQLFEILDPSYTALAIKMMPPDLSEKILSGLSSDKSSSVKRQLRYFSNSLGSHMDPTVFTLKEGMTMKEAMSAIKKQKNRVQPHYYVVSSRRKLLGVLSLSEILTGKPGALIKSVMSKVTTALSPETPIQSVISHHEWNDFFALPVVDQSSLFLGVIRLETIRTVQLQEGNRVEDMGKETIGALGDLYRLGIAGLLRSATELKPTSMDKLRKHG